MTDRPIIFSAPMVRALLAGRKTQTRRIWKLPTKGIYERRDMGGWEATTHGGSGYFTLGRHGKRIPSPETIGIWHRTTGTCLDAPYQIGDRLWIREAWRATSEWDGHPPRAIQPGYTRYEADPCLYHSYGKLRTPIFMPRWASRLTLVVTDVRVQRLQDISEEDAEAEGVHRTIIGSGYRDRFSAEHGSWSDAVEGLIKTTDRAEYAFRDLWNSLHGPDAWSSNPWVAAISFDVHRANIDALPLPSPTETAEADRRRIER